MKKLFVTLAALVTVIGFVAGRGQSNVTTAEGKINIVMSSWLIMEESSASVCQQMVNAFIEENPNISVELIGNPYADTQRQTILAISGGNEPDVMHLVPMFSSPIAAMGVLEDLALYYNQTELDDIPKAALDSGMINGQLVSVPWQLGSIFVLGWKELITQAGYKAMPDTWDDFKVVVEKIANSSDEVYGFGARTDNSANSAFWLYPVMQGFGGTFEDEKGNIVFNSPENIAALEWYKTLGAERMIPYGMGVQEVRVLFSQGRVGFIFDGPWMKGIIRTQSGLGEDVDNLYWVAPFPKAADGKRYGIGNNHVLAVSKNKDQKNKNAATGLIKFLTQEPEITKLYYREMGAIPTYKSLLSDPLYDNPFARVVKESAEFANCLPSSNPKYTAALEFVSQAMTDALAGGDVPKNVADAQAKIMELYGQN